MRPAPSLRARLLISYIIVIVVCLTLAALTLILVARPIQRRLITARLAAQVTLTTPRVQTMLDRGLSPDQIATRIGEIASRRDMRVLLVDRQGQILGDTQGEWQGQLVDDVPRTPNGQPENSGILTGPGGVRLLYAGRIAGQETASPLWIAAVTPSPRTAGTLLGELGQGLLIAGLVALTLSVLLAALITRWVARPLRQMAQAAEAIAAGEYDQTLDIKGPGEARVLAESLELMAKQVKASQQAMRDLVANVSHDLKTPLTSVQGFAQALLEGATQDEAARQRAASVIYEESSRMVRMVEELLDLARIESGQMILDQRPLDLRELVGGVVQALAPVAAEKRVTLQANFPELPPVLGDGDRLAQVFTNLLDNALKYTSEGDRVQVAAQVLKAQPRPQRARPQRGGVLARPDASTLVSLRTDFVEVSIADTGRGIPAEDLPRIFERFYQADKARTSRRGSGLGLAIAKEIIEAHGGRIGIESVEGLGTRITVALPVSTLPSKS
jgi:two-component system OmpR family sensor kinase